MMDLLRLASRLDDKGHHRIADRIDATVRLAMPPYGYHRTEPDRVEDITTHGFHGDIAPEYFDEHFDTFYADLSDEGRKRVDEMSIAAGYSPDEVEMGWDDRWRNRWKKTVEALMMVWDEEHPNDRVVWVSGDPLDDTFGDAAIEVDLEGMPELLNDHSYGAAHRYTLAPGEERIPPSRFRHIPQNEMDANPDFGYWHERSASSSRMTRTAVPHGDAPPEFQPRVIQRSEVPEGSRVMYHATTDLPGVRQLGLVSQDERRKWGWPGAMGIGGGSREYVSLTENRKIAEDIANAMRIMRDVMDAPNSSVAMMRLENHVRNLCQKHGIPENLVMAEGRRMLSSVWYGNRDGDRDVINDHMQNLYDGLKDERATGLKFPLPEELPEGSVIVEMWPHPNPKDPRPRVWKWKEPMTRDEWTFAIAHYFDYMMDEVERRGGPTSPMFFGFDEKNFAFDPNDVGVAEVMVSGPPDRGAYTEFMSGPGYAMRDRPWEEIWDSLPSKSLGEWAGHPDKTRVIL